jgi:ATP-dependent protease ClpP protease subunit
LTGIIEADFSMNGLAITPGQPVYVCFSAEINAATTESLISVMSGLVNEKATTVHLLLSTPGGNVMHGLNLYNLFRGLPFELITHNIGNVDSIGNAIFLAGAKRYATTHSTFMFHGVGFDLNNPLRLEEKFLRERLDSLMSDQKRIGSIIVERTKITEDAVSELFLEAKTKDATFAVSSGIIDEIRECPDPRRRSRNLAGIQALAHWTPYVKEYRPNISGQ